MSTEKLGLIVLIPLVIFLLLIYMTLPLWVVGLSALFGLAGVARLFIGRRM